MWSNVKHDSQTPFHCPEVRENIFLLRTSKRCKPYKVYNSKHFSKSHSNYTKHIHSDMTALTHVEIHGMSSLSSQHSTSSAPKFYQIATTWKLKFKIKNPSKGILHTLISALNRAHTQILAGVFAEVQNHYQSSFLQPHFYSPVTMHCCQ